MRRVLAALAHASLIGLTAIAAGTACSGSTSPATEAGTSDDASHDATGGEETDAYSAPEAAESEAAVAPDATVIQDGTTIDAVAGGDGASRDGADGALPRVISGAVQKGPFVRGSSVTVQELDANLAPTGRTFQVSTDDDEGDFTIPVNVSSQFVEVIATGYYFDELTNQLSSGTLTLHALADLTSGANVEVTLLTSMSEPLVRKLVTGGASFASATTQAETAVLAALGFTPSSLGASFSSVGLTGNGTANGEALAASLIVEQYARSLGSSEVAQLSQLLGEVGAATADSGGDATLAALHAALCPTIWAVDPTAVRANLTTYYASLGASVTVPPFEQFLCGCGILCAAEGGTVCVKGQTDPNNCGACGTTCPSGGSCENGTCVCPVGESASGSQCCPTGQVSCGGACVNEQTDTNNCGGCDASCPANFACQDGGCGCPSGQAGSDAGCCPSGQAACGGGCVDLQTDPNNCGGCGTICSAAAPSTAQCTLGRCLTTLSTGSGVGVAVNATNVYWVGSGPTPRPSCSTFCGALWTVPIGGGTATSLAGKQTTGGVALDSTTAYWISQNCAPGWVESVSLDGGAVSTLATSPCPSWLQINAASVFWTDDSTGNVMSVPLDGGAGGPKIFAATGAAIGIALDSTSVYWMDLPYGDAGSVFRAPLAGLADGGVPTALATDGLMVGGRIAADSANVYWVGGNGAVMKVPSSGGAPVTVVSGPASGMSPITVDATNIYWASNPVGSYGATVLKAPLTGGAVTTLASSHQVEDIAVDGTSVYWTSTMDGVSKLTPK